MYQPDKEVIKSLARGYQVIPLSMEIYGDMLTPIGVLRTLKTVSSQCFLLESVEDSQKWGRYTFLGYDPKMEVTCTDGTVTIRMAEGTVNSRSEDPGIVIEELLREYRSPKLPGMPPFTGGLVGYFSYDYVKYVEKNLTLDAEDAEGFHDVDMVLFDKVIAFDHLKQKIILIVNIRIAQMEEEYERGIRELEEMAKLLQSGVMSEERPGKIKGEFQALFDEREYCAMVEKAKNYIKEGDIFQVVLSNRLEAEFDGSLLDTYRVLRTLNPSPYMFYFTSETLEIAGASPETLVKLEDGVLHTFPLAGTRPRGKNEEEDAALAEGLLKDEKELAEHNMLVDLGRNDLGKISDFGTVKVEDYASILRFSHVMHIGSTVSGRIREDKTAMDAIRAVLPAGTLSGAPKRRACEIINELENNKRGIYGGAIGYLDFSGNMDTCIAIRIAYAKNGKVFIRSGAGIVADSVAENEYQECIHKAKAVKKALETAKGGIEDGTAD